MIDILSKVFCWGFNNAGQLGCGNCGSQKTPKEVISVRGAVTISAGDAHTCIITALKKVLCWGYNGYGQLGIGTTSWPNNIPIEVVGLNNDIVDVSLGDHSTCTIDILSQLYCWGWNRYGGLGLGHTDNKSKPTEVVFNNGRVMKVSLGEYHMCIINNLSQVWCSGGNKYGQLGDGTTIDSYFPKLSSLVTAASQIDLGNLHSCVIDIHSDLYCWGMGGYGQLGLGPPTLDKNVPTKVTAVDHVVQVGAGREATFLVDGNGNIMGMGRNYKGQLGLGDTTHRNIPTLLLTGI